MRNQGPDGPIRTKSVTSVGQGHFQKVHAYAVEFLDRPSSRTARSDRFARKSAKDSEAAVAHCGPVIRPAAGNKADLLVAIAVGVYLLSLNTIYSSRCELFWVIVHRSLVASRRVRKPSATHESCTGPPLSTARTWTAKTGVLWRSSFSASQRLTDQLLQWASRRTIMQDAGRTELSRPG